MQIHHLLYADDIVSCCEAEAVQFAFIRYTLLAFQVVSGLSVNWRKSNVFPIKEVPTLEFGNYSRVQSGAASHNLSGHATGTNTKI